MNPSDFLPGAAGRFFVSVMVLLAAGCEGSGRPYETRPNRTIEDDLGRQVLVHQNIRRIVSLAPSVTEIIFAAGGSSALAAVTTADDFPPEVKYLPQFSAVPVDFEGLLELQPDLVLATDQVNSVRDAERLLSLGIPTYFFHLTDLETVFRAIETTGSILETEDVARQAADSLRNEVAEIVERNPPPDERPVVLFLIGDRTPYTFGADSYIHEIIHLAGGNSATSEFEGPAAVLSEEFVLQLRPDIIIGTFGSDYSVEQLLRHHPAWEILPAVREGRVFTMPGSVILRPGPRLVEATRTIAGILRSDDGDRHEGGRP